MCFFCCTGSHVEQTDEAAVPELPLKVLETLELPPKVLETLEPPAQYLDRVSDSGSSVGRSYSSASSTQVIRDKIFKVTEKLNLNCKARCQAIFAWWLSFIVLSVMMAHF